MALDWLAWARLERMGRIRSDHWLLDGRDWNGDWNGGLENRLVGAAAGQGTAVPSGFLSESGAKCRVGALHSRAAQC